MGNPVLSTEGLLAYCRPGFEPDIFVATLTPGADPGDLVFLLDVGVKPFIFFDLFIVVEFELLISAGCHCLSNGLTRPLMSTSGRGGQPRMGWRKLTVRDRDDGSGALRRGSATHHLRVPASLRIVLMRQHHP